MLAFLNNHELFGSILAQCITLGIDDVSIAELTFTASSLCCMTVTSVGKFVSLRGQHLVELSALAEEEPKEADVLASMDPDRNQQAEHGEGENEYEYQFEMGLALDARNSLSLLHLEQDSQAGLCAMADKGDKCGNAVWDMGLVDAWKSSSLSFSAPPMVAPTAPTVAAAIDWESYDKYIFPAGRYKLVKNESGQIFGQLEPMLLYHGPYKCWAVCKCGAHKGRCSRQRSWKVSAGEAPQMPDRVLARWLVEGASHVSKEKHMASHRY